MEKSLFIVGEEEDNDNDFSYDDDIDIDIDVSTITTTPNVFRFKFSSDFIFELNNFSIVHQYDDRKVFKENFKKWLIDNEELVENEKYLLRKMNYKGDIEKKIFLSSRFYFRKKNNRASFKDEKVVVTFQQEREQENDENENNENDENHENNEENEDKKYKTKLKKRKYVPLCKTLIKEIDEYIFNNIKLNDAVIKPEDGFVNFCKNSQDLLKKIIQFYVGKNCINSADEMKYRVKKLFKNRYYINFVVKN